MITWKSGNANGKQMIVQAVNNFEVTKDAPDVRANDIVILAPGGGSGPNEAGCRNQYGRNWYVLNYLFVSTSCCLPTTPSPRTGVTGVKYLGADNENKIGAEVAAVLLMARNAPTSRRISSPAATGDITGRVATLTSGISSTSRYRVLRD